MKLPPCYGRKEDRALTAQLRRKIEAAIGAALHDHYVWPISAIGGLP